MPPPSLSPERAKVAKFYSARSKTIPPLPWQTFALPFSHFYVQPQECWESIADYFIKIRVDHKRLCIDVETDRLKEGDNLSLMPFINYTGEYQTAEVFLQNLYRRLAWHTHWILKGAPYQVVPTDKNGKLSRVTFQPAKYQFGTIPAPSCNIGDLGDLLFTHALRPVMFTC